MPVRKNAKRKRHPVGWEKPTQSPVVILPRIRMHTRPQKPPSVFERDFPTLFRLLSWIFNHPFKFLVIFITIISAVVLIPVVFMSGVQQDMVYDRPDVPVVLPSEPDYTSQPSGMNQSTETYQSPLDFIGDSVISFGVLGAVLVVFYTIGKVISGGLRGY